MMPKTRPNRHQPQETIVKMTTWLCLAVLLANTSQAAERVRPTAKSPTLACNYFRDLQHPLKTSGEAKLSLQGKSLQEIHFHNTYANGANPWTMCHFDAARLDGVHVWTDHGPETTITNKITKDSLRIRLKTGGIELIFADLKAVEDYCGKGAEFPTSLFAPYAGNACKAEIP